MGVIAKAGTLPYRRLMSGEIEILAIARHGSDHWILPMGRIEPGEIAKDAAIRETQEEAGINVHPQAFIGKLCFGEHEVEYFLSQYLGDVEWPEKDQRQRCWIPLSQAEEIIAPDFHIFVVTARKVLESVQGK